VATAVTIQITVDSAQANAAMSALTKAMQDAGANGDIAFKRAGQGAQQMTGHVTTGLDAVRLLSQEFGLRLPRAMEAMLSRMPAVTNALTSMLGGLTGIAATEVFVHLGEDVYKLYEQYISLNAQAEKFYETLKKTAQEDFSQTRSIETTRRRADTSTQNSSALPGIASALQQSAIGQLLQGNVIGALALQGGARTGAQLGVDAAGNMVKLGKVQLDQTHEQALAQIELNHAMDGALVGEQKINAEAAKKKQIDAENREFNRKTEMYYGNPAAADAGAAEQRMKDQQADAEARAQSIVLGRSAALEIMKAHDEMVQSNLQGDELYLRKYSDTQREMTLAMSNEGKSAEEIHASVLAAQAKLDEEYADKWMTNWRTRQEAMANARAGGLSGAARIVADFENAQNRNNSNPDLVASGGAHDANVAAQTEMFQKLKELQDNFTESTLASVQERTQAELGGYERIDAEGTKALADLQKAYDKAFKDANGNDLGTPAVQAAMAQARSAIAAKTQDEKNKLTEQNNATDLQYTQEAERAEARVREDGFAGWIAQYKNTVTEIEDQQREHLARMEEQAKKDGASQPEIEQRKQAIVRESNAQIEQLNQQMQHQIAGTLQEAFTNPVDFIKSAMEKMFFEIVASWIMRMKAFQSLLGTTMAGGGAGTTAQTAVRSVLGIGGGAGGSIAGGGSGTASQVAAGGGSGGSSFGAAGISGTVGSISSVAQSFGIGSGGSTASSGSYDFNGPMTGDTPDLRSAGAASASWLGQNGGALLGAAGGGYNAYSGTVSAFKTGNPLTGAAADAGEGALIGSIVPGVGTAIGAAVGAAIGGGSGLAGAFSGEGGKLSARDYYNKQVFPALNNMMMHPNGDFQTAISAADQLAANALNYMGQHYSMNAANWVNDNYMKKELQKVVTTIADTAQGGRQFTQMNAMQFHSGGTITGFGDYATSYNEGMIHAQLGETVMTPGASATHGAMLAAMNSGASAADIASRYLAGSGAGGMSAQSGSGGDTHFHIHTLDTRTMQGWLKTGGAQMINKHLNDFNSQYAGDGIAS